MKYSIDKIMNKTLLIKEGGPQKIQPLRWLQNMNKLDIMTIEEYLEKYNQYYKNFSLRELVNKLEANCVIYNKTNPHGEPQVSDSYIYEKLTRHFTEFKKGTTKKRTEDRKYNIYFTVDTRNITDYASIVNSTRKKKLIQRYTYKNPLNRIHGFLITDDTPCLCKSPKKKYISIVIICANPHASNANIKAVGSYLLMFAMVKAYEYNFHKIILEVTNSENDITSAIEEEKLQSDDEDSGEEDDDEDSGEEDSGEEDSDEEDSGEEDSDEEGSDKEDSDEEDSDKEDSDEEENKDKCCDIKIKRNLMCNKDKKDTKYDHSTDKYTYHMRIEELEKYMTDDLFELIQCYDIDYYGDVSKQDALNLLNYYGFRNSMLPRSKKKIIDFLENFEQNNDHLLKERIIKAILKFEYWDFDEYVALYDGEKCRSDWNTGNLDMKTHGYNGINYEKGKMSTKSLYCNFYEKHGFIEDSMLNVKEKCFSADPLPAMYIDTKKNTLKNLIRVFIERKFYKEPSDFCKSTGLEIAPGKIIIQ